MCMISSDVVLSKFMAKTRFRGETALVNVVDFVVAIVSLSLGACADVLPLDFIAIKDFTILLFLVESVESIVKVLLSITFTSPSLT